MNAVDRDLDRANKEAVIFLLLILVAAIATLAADAIVHEIRIDNPRSRKAMSEKTLHNLDMVDAERNVVDFESWGGDQWQVLCKAWSASKGEGWMKSTKAMLIPGVGVLVQVTTQQRNPGGGYRVAEAVTFVPGVKIVDVMENEKVVERRLVRVE